MRTQFSSFISTIRSSLAILFLGGLILFVQSSPAYADPHAVFYTAVGQQQLFFNTLSALDQADYVEPATSGPGTPPGTSREDLLKERTQAGFGPEEDKKVAATETKLSGILNRNITLEGQDLWTAYLTHQFALEVARRTATDEVLRVYCERGLGRPGCSNKPEDQKRDEAFVVNPNTEINKPILQGNAALDSGTEADQAIRQKIVANQAPQEARPYNEFIAEAREHNKNDPAKAQAIERLAAAASNVGSNAVDPHVYDDLQIDEEGNVISTAETIDEFTNSLASLSDQPSAYLTTKINYQKRAQIAQDITTDSGVKADTDITPKKGSSGAKGNIGSIDEIITTPVRAKTALIDAGSDIIGQEATNLAYAVPKGENTPGKQELVNRPPAGQTKGIRTSSNNEEVVSQATQDSAKEGKVAGILDLVSGLFQIFGFYDQPKQPLDPNVNPIAPIRESGSERFVEALTSDTYRRNDPNRATSGYGLDTNSARNTILQQGQAWLCSTFPSLCQ